MSHKDETGMADLDMPQFESIPGVIQGYAHKRVSKDGFPDNAAIVRASK